MTTTEHLERDALPLAEAAASLGITPDALRMRIRRGRAEGFKRGGRLFVYLPEIPIAAGASEHGSNASGSVRFREAAVSGAQSGQPAGSKRESIPVVVEFQKIEITRLLRDNQRLNERLDQSVEEARNLREMLQREQVLRQQDQTFRQQMQRLLDHLTGLLALPRPSPDLVDHADQSESDPSDDTEIEAEIEATAGEDEASTIDATETPADATGTDTAGPPDDDPEGGADAPEAAVDPLAAQPPDPAPPVGPQPEPDGPSAREPADGSEDKADPPPPEARPETAELAEMLKELGASLREVEAGLGETPDRGDNGAPTHGEHDQHDETFDASAPSEEERRNAARMMKKLFRNRAMPRDREP